MCVCVRACACSFIIAGVAIWRQRIHKCRDLKWWWCWHTRWEFNREWSEILISQLKMTRFVSQKITYRRWKPRSKSNPRCDSSYVTLVQQHSLDDGSGSESDDESSAESSRCGRTRIIFLTFRLLTYRSSFPRNECMQAVVSHANTAVTKITPRICIFTHRWGQHSDSTCTYAPVMLVTVLLTTYISPIQLL